MQPTDALTGVINSFKCKSCGAAMAFSPASGNLQCQYCQQEELIDSGLCTRSAFDYKDYIANKNVKHSLTTLATVRCSGCGSTSVLEPDVLADVCPFCASPLVTEHTPAESIVRPHYLLPFALDNKAATQSFKNWVSSRWFMPFDIHKHLNSGSAPVLKGVYLPHWSFDSDTTTDYTGSRGDYYYTTERYTVNNNGRTETRTRQVRHTRWSSARGTVHNSFEDIIVPATLSLPQGTLTQLEPWDLQKMKNFDERYLCGFRSENFMVTPKQGFENAKNAMEPAIRDRIYRHIGGDEQRIDNTNTVYENNAIKYLVLPVWVSAYKYNKKTYQFVVNARTGEVIGDRPYSGLKIFFLVLFILIAIAFIVMIFMAQ